MTVMEQLVQSYRAFWREDRRHPAKPVWVALDTLLVANPAHMQSDDLMLIIAGAIADWREKGGRQYPSPETLEAIQAFAEIVVRDVWQGRFQCNEACLRDERPIFWRAVVFAAQS